MMSHTSRMLAGVAVAVTMLASSALAAEPIPGGPARLQGIVVLRNQPYKAWLSLGSNAGLRNGATVEYVVDGVPVATGKVYDVARGDAMATIEPEAASPLIRINTRVRTLTIPSAKDAGPTVEQLQDREINNFDRDFGLAAVVAAGIYYGLIK